MIIDGSEVEQVESFKFLAIHVSSDLTWSALVRHCVTKAQRRLFFLRRLRGFGLDRQVLVKFYHTVIESVLSLSITIWFGGLTAAVVPCGGHSTSDYRNESPATLKCIF